jgi:hypothetical protein
MGTGILRAGARGVALAKATDVALALDVAGAGRFCFGQATSNEAMPRHGQKRERGTARAWSHSIRVARGEQKARGHHRFPRRKKG